MTDSENIRLLHAIDLERDHVRGGADVQRAVTIVYYGDFLCPYCRRLRVVLRELKDAIGENMAYAFRHFPNERAHPGAEFMARAVEAAENQGRFWDLYDALFDEALPFTEIRARELAREIGLDMDRFECDLESEDVRDRVAAHLNEAKRNGVTGTPTIFIDGVRYDGAWDYFSLLDVLERPLGERIQRSARAFASLPAAGGLVLIFASLVALGFTNSPLASAYSDFIHTSFGIGQPGSFLSLTVGEWCSEGLLAFFFLLVGLEIRREMTAGILKDRKAAILPVAAAMGASIVPALIYLAINHGGAVKGWSVPTATDIAFALGVLALLGDRVPVSIRVFVAAFAVVDDIISVLVLAIFYPHNFEATWLFVAIAAIAMLYVLNRSRVYAIWPYVGLAIVVWFFLHSAGVHGALAGIALAAFLPTRPKPAAGPLLAQAATALAALEHAEREGVTENSNPVLEWASRNLSAASERLLSPANRIEQAVAPWSSYFVLPLFAFSATGVSLNVDLSSPGSAPILIGVIVGLVIGKPLGVCVVAWFATATRIARMPEGAGLRVFIGAACLCGIGDTVSLLMADQAFLGNNPQAAIAKIGVLIASVLAAAIGATIIMLRPTGAARTEIDCQG